MRYGYTTGSCAAAASKAAVVTLFEKEQVDYMRIDTPKGWVIDIEVKITEVLDKSVTCYVIKDSGDDPDVTNGMSIYAKAQLMSTPGITIDGGIGIGRVTKKGLSVPIGEAAINPVPRMMIKDEVAKMLPEGKGVHITIFAPEGAKIAKKTFNPKLGIVDGISILGTKGIVEPMSEEAFKEALKVELSVKRATGIKQMIYAFGNFGRDYLSKYKVDEYYIQKTSNFVQYMVKEGSKLGIEKIIYVGHAGKMIKVAAGMTNTHSKYGDGRMASIASCAIECGLSEEVREQILRCNTTDEAVELLQSLACCDKVFEEVARRCKELCEEMANNQITVECIIFSNQHGTLARTKGAKTLLKEMAL